MIGSWDETGCVFAMMPAAWKNGNGSANKFTGNFPMYPSANVTMSFNGFGAGEGYDTATGKLIVPGVNEHGIISNAQQLWDNGAPFSIEYIMNPQITAANVEVMTVLREPGLAPFRMMFIDLATYLGLSLTCGSNAGKFGYGNRATFNNIKRHIAITYNGGGVNTIGNWALYLGGSPVALAPYTGASVVNNGENYLFTNNPKGLYGECEQWAQLIYNVELSAARVAVNAGLGDDYGLVGNNVGDLMNLTAPIKGGVPVSMLMSGGI